MSIPQASLDLARGVLAVGLHAKTASVQLFDLGGRRLSGGCSFRDPLLGRSSAAGLALDPDHRLLVADTPAARLRCFSLFGREVGGIGGSADRPAADRPGLLGHPVDVTWFESEHGAGFAVACAGERRHALQLFDPELVWRRSLVSFGVPGQDFRGLRRVASLGPFLFAVEAGRRCIQVFRAGEFLFSFHLTRRNGERHEPLAIAPLEDGRMVIACGGAESALLLADGAGRPRRLLAAGGSDGGQVLEPCDLAVQAGADEERTLVYALDQDGVRLQVFTLTGRCLGAIPVGLADAGCEASVEDGRREADAGGREADAGGKKGGR
jgi:hypothetical protein